VGCAADRALRGPGHRILNQSRVKPASSTPEIRFRIDFTEKCAVAPAKIDLLEAIRESGSLARGARHIGMSYRRARQLIDSFKGAFRDPVTRAVRGGPGGGAVMLTPFGEELVDRYRSLEAEIRSLATRRLETISALATRGNSRDPAGRVSVGKI